MREIDGRIVWAQKVEAHLIRRLYQQDARGILDVELIDEVAYALLDRCTDILAATRAVRSSQATCPRCFAPIDHDGRPATVLRCSCGWSSTWKAYHASMKGQRIHGGSALPFFEEYVVGFDRADSAKARMLLVDRLLNQWHTWARSIYRPKPSPRFQFASRREGDVERFPVVPTAVSLITGADPIALLDELSGISERVIVPPRA